MADELQTGSIPATGLASVATAENSTTLRVQLAAQKKWKVVSTILATLGGILLTGASVSAAVNPTVFFVLLGTGGLSSVLAVIFASFAGAELDEKKLEEIGEKVALIIQKKQAGK